jgi:peroxiredoxin
MKIYLISIFAIFMFNCNIYSDVIVKGNILTYDNKVPEISNVSYFDKDENKTIIQTRSDGSFEFKIENMPSVTIQFSAPNHHNLMQNFIIQKGKNELNISVKLKPFQNLKNLKEVMIFGNFNNYDSENLKLMTLNEDSTYSFSVKNDSDTLIYQIFPNYTSYEGNHTFNGTQSDFFQYDSNGDYFSCVIDKDKNFNIVFNPNGYSSEYFEPEIKFDDSVYSRNFNSYLQAKKEFDDYIGARSMILIDKEIPDSDKRSNCLQAKKEFMAAIKNLISNIDDINFRNLTLIEYLQVAHDGVDIDGIDGFVDKKLVKEIYNISPDDEIWNSVINDYSLVFAEIILGNIENPEYLNSVLKTKLDKEKKAGILAVLVGYCNNNKYTELQDKYYNTLISDYPDTKEAKNAKFRFGKDKTISIGKQIPDFSLVNIDNKNEKITPEYLKGKYVLVDVWGTWCLPCIMELPNLVEAYNKFKDKNFTIYSVAIDASESNVTKFRENKNKMPWLKPEEQIESNLPWLHSYAGTWESDMVAKFEVTGVPSTFLIDPLGKIIAIEGLRGEELIKTLEKFIK